MTKYITIEFVAQRKKPLFVPWCANYKCREGGYFWDGTYGYFGINSYAKDYWGYLRSCVLSWFGLYLEWRCDGTGTSRLRRQRNR